MAFTSSDIDRLTGATVRSSDNDKIGSIGQVYVDPDGTPNWATVKTGLFGTSESFVPLDLADFSGNDVRIPFDKDTVKAAPRVEADGELNETETDGLYDYYEARSPRTAPVADPTIDTTAPVDDRATETGTVEPISSGSESGQVRDETSKPHDGYDTSGPTTDDAMTRSEERLKVGTRQTERGRVRLQKHIVTEQQTVTVPVTHEEARLVREPITDQNVGDATAGPELSEEEHEVVLHGEEVVVDKDVVPVERVRLGTEAVTEDQQVTEDVRKEQIELEDPNNVTETQTGR